MRFNKILILIGGFYFCLKASAAILYPPPETDHEGWHVGFQAIYTQNNFNTPTSSTPTATSTTVQTIPVNWTLGYKTQIAYLFDEDLDLNLNWVHFNSTSSQNTQSEDNLSGQYTVNQFGSAPESYTNAAVSEINQVDTNIDNKVNTVNFEFGRSSFLTEHIDLRIQVGIQYANIQQNVNQTASNTTINSEFNYNDDQRDTSFSGIGPRAGFDIYYGLGGGFFLITTQAFALPTGRVTINSTAHQSNETNTGLGNTVTATSNELKLISDYEAVFGLRFEQIFLESKFGIDVGYQMTSYDIAKQSGFFLGLRAIH